MAKKKKDEEVVEVEEEAPKPKPTPHPSGRIFTWDNGGRHQAIHESGTHVAASSGLQFLDIPASFITDDGVAVLTKDCGIEAIPAEEVAEHAGLEAALEACCKRQDEAKKAEPAGPTIVTGEVATGVLGKPK